MDAKTTLIIITIVTTVGLTITGSARQVFASSISLKLINESTHIADIVVFQAHTYISHEQSVIKAAEGSITNP